MKWGILLVLLSVLLLPVYSFGSTSEMTDEEILTELLENLERRENLLNQREQNLNALEKYYETREQSLTQRSETLEMRLKLLDETESYLKSYSADVERRARLNLFRGIGWGIVGASIAYMVFF